MTRQTAQRIRFVRALRIFNTILVAFGVGTMAFGLLSGSSGDVVRSGFATTAFGLTGICSATMYLRRNDTTRRN